MKMGIDVASQIKGNNVEQMTQKYPYFFYYIYREFATTNNRKSIYEFEKKVYPAFSEETLGNQHE